LLLLLPFKNNGYKYLGIPKIWFLKCIQNLLHSDIPFGSELSFCLLNHYPENREKENQVFTLQNGTTQALDITMSL